MLRLEEPPATLAARYHGGDLPDDEVDRHPVLARWRRAARHGVKADAAAHPEGTSASDLGERRDRMAAIFREEAPLLAPMADELSERSLVAVISDHEGVLLLTRGGGALASEAVRVRLVEGSRWAEGTRGTNAIGTALAEGRPVAVVGRAHFEERNHGLFCYATPIRDPYGEIVAALDVTGAVAQHSPAVGVAVQAAGAALERALRLRAYAAATTGGLAVVERMLRRTGGPALLVEATGHVLLLNDAARAALGVTESERRLGVERVFGVSVDALREVAAHANGARFETGSASYRVEVEPILDAKDRVLSLIVYLAPITTEGVAPCPAGVPSGAAARAAGEAPDQEPPVPHAFQRILGTDPAIAQAKRMAARFAPTEIPILLLAETGTGKELFARAIHEASGRAGAFVALNCGALAPSLLEGELFGYAPGAFTGAGRAGSDGKIAAADGGTLFLDEMAEMPEALQATLLRVLEAGEYFRLGDPRPRRSRFRLVSATCRDLAALVAAGRFRRDLFYRVHGALVTLPAVRHRSDRLVLARGLLAEMVRAGGGGPVPELEADAIAWLMEHDWPGNARELKSALAHACVMSAERGRIDRACFPRPILSDPPPAAEVPDAPGSRDGRRTRTEILRGAADEALRAASGNFSEAARRLGVARSTLYRMIGRP